MSGSTLILLLLLITGIIGRSNVIAAAAGILLVIQFTNLEKLYPVLETRGVELGLLFLILAVLIPFASGRIHPGEIPRTFITFPGIVALVSGTLATTLNGHGLDLLQKEPTLMIGLVIGSIVGIIFFGGIPVGPLMAGGIAALLLGISNLFK